MMKMNGEYAKLKWARAIYFALARFVDFLSSQLIIEVT